jgi:hypothetical protein
MMKKYTSILLFALLFSSCDDGDLIVETFNFEEVSIAQCQISEDIPLLYKIKDQESLLLQLSKDDIRNELTLPDQPRIITVDNTTRKLLYRTYDGPITVSNICDLIRPATPNILTEWFAAEGKIQITTKPSYTVNEAQNSSRITGYTHSIEVQNVTYSKPGVQVGPQFIFGDFTTQLLPTETLNLVFNEAASQCPDTQKIYNARGSESFTIDNPELNLIVNTPTLPGAPRVVNIGTTNNKVTFRVYNSSTIPDGYFCTTPVPTSPSVRETWTAEGGTIEVETSTLGGNFKHIIKFKNVKLVKGNVSFMLGNNFAPWELITTP